MFGHDMRRGNGNQDCARSWAAALTQSAKAVIGFEISQPSHGFFPLLLARESEKNIGVCR
jgi:hypothetical protein